MSIADGSLGIPKDLAEFLRAFRSLDSRIDAALEAGIPWEDVERALVEKPEFARQYNAIMKERRIRCLDLILHNAINDKDSSAAKAYLAAEEKAEGVGEGADQEPAGYDAEFDEHLKLKASWLSTFVDKVAQS